MSYSASSLRSDGRTDATQPQPAHPGSSRALFEIMSTLSASRASQPDPKPTSWVSPRSISNGGVPIVALQRQVDCNARKSFAVLGIAKSLAALCFEPFPAGSLLPTCVMKSCGAHMLVAQHAIFTLLYSTQDRNNC